MSTNESLPVRCRNEYICVPWAAVKIKGDNKDLRSERVQHRPRKASEDRIYPSSKVYRQDTREPHTLHSQNGDRAHLRM